MLLLAREYVNPGVNGEGTAISIPERDDECWLSKRCVGLAEDLAGDIGEIGERGEIGEMEDMVRSSCFGKLDILVKILPRLK